MTIRRNRGRRAAVGRMRHGPDQPGRALLMDSMLMEEVDMKRLQPALDGCASPQSSRCSSRRRPDAAATSQADDSKALEGKTWRAVQIAGLTTVMTAKGSASTATFSAGRGGRIRARSTAGAPPTPPARATPSRCRRVTTTEMAGPPENMDQEAAYYAALPKAATYQVTETSLTLLDDKGGVLVKYEVVPPAPLTGTEWQMTGYNTGTGGDQPVSSDSPSSPPRSAPTGRSPATPPSTSTPPSTRRPPTAA